MTATLPIRVVLPTFNEAENLEPLSAAVLAAAPEGTGILVVDDASPDGTGELADRLAAADRRIDVLHRSEQAGARTRLRRRLRLGARLGRRADRPDGRRFLP